MSEQTPQPFQFMGRPYINTNRLLDAMAANWKDGRETLFSGKVSAYFKTVNRTLYNSAQSAEKAFQAEPNDGDLLFWKWIYTQAEVPKLYWRNRDFGYEDEVLALLRGGTDIEFNRLLILLMKNRLFSTYAKSAGMAKETIENVKYVEKCYNRENSGYIKRKTGRLLYAVLSQKKKFMFDAQSFDDVKALASYLQSIADISKDRLHNKVQMLFLDDYNLDPAFEGWLLTLGYQHEVSLWNDKFQPAPDGTTENEDEDDVGDGSLSEPQTEPEKEDFAISSDEFETKFLDMLQKYPDTLTDSQRFTGLLKDYFPQSPMQAHLIETLYKMDIVKALQDAKEIRDVFTMRFIKRLVNDFGTKEAYAKWAVSVWCVCYGEKVLGKPCMVTLSRAV
ncbi:MAG: hypothetical protein LUE29_07400 [Lachnospiraceae bacterium]|nr:hypothetical protein [Lachnospiraceae bacterium]